MDKRHILGIDVGTAAVKVFSGTMADENDIIINSIGLMPTRGLDKGVISDCNALSASIRQAVNCVIAADQIAGINAYLGIGGMGLNSLHCAGSVAPLSPKAITSEDIDRVCRSAVLAGVPTGLAALHVLPLCFWVDKERQTVIPIGKKGACLEVEVFIVTVPQASLNELIEAVQKTGIHVAGVVANSIVGTQALQAHDGGTRGIVVDIGAGITEIALYQEGVIYYSASLPLGGNYITRDIVKALEISEQHAEGVKRYYSRLDRALRGQAVMLDCNDYGTIDKQVSYDFLSNVIESRVEEIVFFLQEYVKGLKVDHPIDEILFTGGCSALPSFSIALEKCFGVQVKIKVPDQLLAEYAYPSNTACYGIMLHAAHHSARMELEFSTNPWSTFFKKIRKFF
ncbi:Cell division protein FtsA [bioreactor metagenome]|uniref:Cell division protein FtsA n=1 Tax=bioreactor metagenome TaxID=1076179 RepID=A0A644T1B9_9ZZZZ|nr:cell division protein FtsA [Negativicutes bacterium]